jgi:methanogenic corrinoid protein MtbC1
VDSGDVKLVRTAGGHRRIPLAEATQFIRKINAVVVRPDLLGLMPVRGGVDNADAADVTTATHASDDQRLYDALLAGDARLAKALIQSWYVGGRDLPGMFDGPVRVAMHRIGELWAHDSRGILQEHRATAICVEALAGLRTLMIAPDAQAPLALGGAPQGDPYQIPSMMAALVLSDCGYREVNFGANTPVALLATEAIERRAKFVWISVSEISDHKSLCGELRNATKTLATADIPLVLGGRRHAECTIDGPRENVVRMGSMAELAAYARGARG